MNLERLPHEPSALIEFYQEALEHLGAVTERTWHDRLELVAEGTAATLWNAGGAIHQTELRFPPPDESAPRDAVTEIFPGCPLTFRLAELLQPKPLTLERAVIAPDTAMRAPQADVAEKLWHTQMPGHARMRMKDPLFPAHTFSLLALVRCEIQAIDQHWSLHRVAVSLPDGHIDQDLPARFHFLDLLSNPPPLEWPPLEPAQISELFKPALEKAVSGELEGIRNRQQKYLRREIDRIDAYFANYEGELMQRSARANSAAGMKASERLEAAKIEHQRRRQDQFKRHGIQVIPHFDSLLFLAEPAWRTTVSFQQQNLPQTVQACFIPRLRRWQLL
jgi:hypothetical protein